MQNTGLSSLIKWLEENADLIEIYFEKCEMKKISLTSLSLCKSDSQNQDRANVSPHLEVGFVNVFGRQEKSQKRLTSFEVSFLVGPLYSFM